MKNLQPADDDPKRAFRYRDQPLGEVVEVEVAYIGSLGIHLAVRPVTVTEDSYSMVLMAGHQALIRRVARRTPRPLREVAEAVDARAPELAAAFRADREKGRDAFEALVAELTSA